MNNNERFQLLILDSRSGNIDYLLWTRTLPFSAVHLPLWTFTSSPSDHKSPPLRALSSVQCSSSRPFVTLSYTSADIFSPLVKLCSFSPSAVMQNSWCRIRRPHIFCCALLALNRQFCFTSALLRNLHIFLISFWDDPCGGTSDHSGVRIDSDAYNNMLGMSKYSLWNK